ncbi:NAD(P)-binding domain-containing protein [Paenibacillus sp. TRM 82003]|uniref:NADPH-dependent F420 reductase n=1 Tax=Kineococcus sp. TRM81007 TaxID=2925831 RepID=UPI001F586286|nr:NAD(P)-binding domain-containing protein [Kineococcus sp. TRM81007]MCI2239800.1 NAD(P)-binding domain-containing protein [Kineococcus sp. TRM81007]MCI3925897.1 NAD(P)-binding domain-containing protein [Paenibacillus sp. TRM 82003]
MPPRNTRARAGVADHRHGHPRRQEHHVRIGVIGAGNIGGNLTRAFTRLGHEVRVANSRGPETLADLAAETGASAVTAAEAAREADLVVVTVPEKNVPDLAGALDGAADGTVVVDTGNYYPRERDGRIDAIEAGTPETAWVAQQLDPAGRLRWVKAFNGIQAEHLLSAARPAGDPERRGLPLAGDDAAAKAVVADLVFTMGFDAVDAGPLAESWRQQPGTPVYGAELDADGVARALGEAPRERPADFTA